jgi:hypothetical protein
MSEHFSGSNKAFEILANLGGHPLPPHNHQVNAAERAIATFKEHFIAALATVDMHCPLQLWDEFLPQVEITLNMLASPYRIPTGQPTRMSTAASIST